MDCNTDRKIREEILIDCTKICRNNAKMERVLEKMTHRMAEQPQAPRNSVGLKTEADLNALKVDEFKVDEAKRLSCKLS